MGNTGEPMKVTDSFMGVVIGKRIPRDWKCQTETFILG